MKTDEDAVNLAKAMVRIGNNVGRQTMAVISDMSQPLGFAIGNALEVKEAIDTLKGEGPEDLTELVLTLGSQMVVLAKKAETLDEAREKLIDVMKNGKALQKFKDFLQNQGGDSSVADNPEKLPQAAYKIDIPAKEAGVVSEIVADQIGVAAMLLGAGRATKEDKIDLAVGIMLRKKVGDAVEKGEPLVTLYANRENVDDVIAKVYDNIQIAEKAEAPKLVHTVITE
jgi:pyrimidine-nucleoside phosphorylase